jgi:glyoxylate reductase
MPQEALDMLTAEADLEVWPDDERPPQEVLLSRALECYAILTTIEDRVDQEVLQAGQGTLKVVANMAVGYDNVDVQAATSLGVAVSNTPDVLIKTTADLAFALLMAAARRLVEGDRDVRLGRWQRWHPFAYVGKDVHGASLSILGLGKIGMEMAKRALGFEMSVSYYSRSRRPDMEERYGLTYCQDLPTALDGADFVSVHTPLTPETNHLIGAEELRLMKPTAILVNSARGAVVDNIALYEALRAGIIAGAGLDVMEPEPIPMDHPLLTLPNVVISPHIGSASLETRTEMAVLAARNIVARLKGDAMPTCLNPEALTIP